MRDDEAMALIERYLPVHRLRELHGHADAAPPRAVWRVARDLVRDELRFVPPGALSVLEERTGRAVVLGAIGRFWEPVAMWRVVDRATFAAFDAPGWGKVAWELVVEPRGDGGAWVTREVRATATDEASWEAFRRCFGRIGPFAHLMRSVVAAELG